MGWILHVEGLMSIMEGHEIRPSTSPGSRTCTPNSGVGSKKDWDDRNLISLALLNNALDHLQQPLIAHCQTAAEAWGELQSMYKSRDISMQMHLRDALYSLKKRPSDTMSQHITKFRLLLNQLAAIGRTIPEDKAYICILRSLPPEYSSFVRSMRTLQVSSTQYLIASILHKESHLKEEELANGMAALYTASRDGWTSTPKIVNGVHSRTSSRQP